MKEMTLTPIGYVRATEDDFFVELLPRYLPALEGLNGFSHIQLVWWFSGCDNDACRASLTERKPYVHGPATLGVFATRSPARPNPIALSCVEVTYIDPLSGRIGLTYTDAFDGSPVLDVKPYTPSLDRVETPAVPKWCAHWPDCTEDSGDFAWEEEFTFM